MSLSSKLAGKNAEDKEFQEILKEILPQKKNLKQFQGKRHFPLIQLIRLLIIYLINIILH